jgi:signal transduction histidine kinase
MVMILLAGLLAAQLASLWLQWGERASVVSQARGLNFADRVVEVIRVLEAEPPARREVALAALRASDLHLTLITDEQVSPNEPRGQIQATIAARLGSTREIRSLGGGGGGGAGMGGGGRMMQHSNPAMRRFDVRLNDGQWLRIVGTNEVSAPPALSNDLIVQLLITLFIIAAVVMIAVRQATRPLQQLATAADALGSDLDAPPLAETGPTETRRAAQAFNRMQARIKHLIDERARALAAVSHDLRTPLTRLRLRAELVDDEKLREQMATDLDAMASMIDATLDYLRGLQDAEVARPIDMNALLQSLADDAAVLGKIIRVDGMARSPYTGRLSALRRAVQNLIDNAIKYGHSAHIRIDDDATALRIVLEDEGPGIAPAELARVTEPYYRPDASRSRETGGVGLGLSIVKDIALLHGGELALTNRPQGGLSAALVLPRSRNQVSPV